MSELHERISSIIKEDINPALSDHNGFVDLIEVEYDNEQLLVALQFYGACQGCSSSTGATKIMIQNYLKEELDTENLTVINVDHD